MKFDSKFSRPESIYILHICDFIYPYVIGGSSRFASDLNNAFLELGHLSFIITRPTYNSRYRLRDGISVGVFVRSVISALALSLARRFDLLIAHHYLLASFFVAIFRYSKFIYFYHGPIQEESLIKGSSNLSATFKKILEQRLLRRADQIYCLSQSMKQTLPKRFWVKTLVCGPKLDFSRIASTGLQQSFPTDGALTRLLIARRLTPRTDVVGLLSVLREIEGVDITVAGGGELYDSVVAEFGDFATITGPLSDEKLYQAIRKSTLVVVPSAGYEGFGLIILEALALGVPVLVSKSAGPGYDYVTSINPLFGYHNQNVDEVQSKISAIKKLPRDYMEDISKSVVVEFDMINFVAQEFTQIKGGD